MLETAYTANKEQKATMQTSLSVHSKNKEKEITQKVREGKKKKKNMSGQRLSQI